MGNLYGNNKPKQTIQKASPENITYQEGPPGTENNIQQVCFFAIAKKRFCSKCTKLVILDYMFRNRMIGIMQNITFQMFNLNIFLQYNFVVRICPSPMSNPSIEKADFYIRVPASMPDKFAAIVAASIHSVSKMCIIFFCLLNTSRQYRIQDLVGIEHAPFTSKLAAGQSRQSLQAADLATRLATGTGIGERRSAALREGTQVAKLTGRRL